MTRYYHAYLPPTSLTPLDQLGKPVRTELYSVVIPGPSQTGLETALSAAEQSQSALPVDVSPSSTQPSGGRRSKRIRTSASFTSTRLLPTWEPSASHQSSLNTTFSLSGQTVPTDSLSNLPRWTVPLSKLTPLASIVREGAGSKRPRTRRSLTESDGRRTVSVVCCVMSAESPMQFQKRAQGGGRGRAGGWATGWRASWRVSAPGPGSESASEPASCDVKLWDDCARDWGGSVRKGDVVLLQNVSFSPATTTEEPRITLSPSSGDIPAPIILYRTLPRYTARKEDYVYLPGARGAQVPGERGSMSNEDRPLRPLLRVSDPGMRLVATMAQWCAEWVGGEPPVM